MKSIALVLAASAIATGCSVVDMHRVHGSGVSATRAVQTSAFKRIETNGAFDLEVQQASKSDLKVIGDDNIVKLVKFENRGDTLVVWVDENYSADSKLRIVASMPMVEGIQINGSGSATIKDVKGDKLELEINGSGDISAVGNVKEFSAKINGSGDIDGSGVESDAASAAISGSGTIKVYANKSLSAAVSGSGDILYKGKPQVSKSIDGSGEVVPM